MMRTLKVLGLAVVFISVCTASGFANIPEGPYLQNVTSTGVTVCLTSTGADATVEYGLDSSYGSEVSSSTPIVIGYGSQPLFQVRIDGLDPSTVYHYRVTSGGETTADKFFTTTVDPGDAFSFCAYGDNRNPTFEMEAIATAMAGEFPDLVVHSGDLVLADVILGITTTYEWLKFFQKTGVLISQAPLFAIRGNHDDDSGFFVQYMDNPTASSGSELYYSFDYGNAHFLALDSTLEECSGAQLAFVESDLAAHAGSGPLFAFFHHPPFSNGSHGGSQSTHDCWAPIFQEYGVDAVFGGHDHLYTRYGTYPVGSPVDGINGVTYVVSGGGGAPLYPPNSSNQAPIAVTEAVYHYVVLHVSGNTISATMKRLDGTTGDTFTIDATDNDGIFDRTDPLPPKGDGGPCGTVPGDAKANRLAVTLYLFPALFLFGLKGAMVRRRYH